MKDIRATAPGHLAGQSRAYLQQLDLARAELLELRSPDLDSVLDAIRQATTAVEAVNRTATDGLRRS